MRVRGCGLRAAFLISVSALSISTAAPAMAAPAAPAAASKALPKTDGFIPFYWDAAKGRVLLEINAFDQWGVELGKELATALMPVIEGKAPGNSHDSSTAGLAAYLAS